MDLLVIAATHRQLLQPRGCCYNPRTAAAAATTHGLLLLLLQPTGCCYDCYNPRTAGAAAGATGVATRLRAVPLPGWSGN